MLFSCQQANDKQAEQEMIADLGSINIEEEFIVDEDKVAWIDSVLQHSYKKHQFNGCVLVAEKGKIVYKGAFGYANLRQRKDTLTTHSAFQLASVSKPITAIAVMLLYEDGKIDFDEKVQTYIPEFPYDNISVRNLLNHRSGLPRYMSLGHKHWKDKKKAMSNEDMLQFYVDHNPMLETTPGRRFLYNNTNYAMLALLVQRVSKQDFDLFVKERIFVPLYMDDSYVYTKVKNEDPPAGVPGYRLRGRRYREAENDYLNGVMGDKNVYSSVEDLFKLDQALYSDRLLSQATVQNAFERGGGKRNRNDYGFGWRIKRWQDDMVYHFGWWKGFKTGFIRKLDEEKTIIVLNNRENIWNFPLYWKILEYKTPAELEAEAEQHQQSAVKGSSSNPVPFL